MARETLVNGETGLSIRNKLNAMMQEIYEDLIAGLNYLGALETGDSVTGSPAAGDYYLVVDSYSGTPCYGQSDVTTVQRHDMLIYNGSDWERLPYGRSGLNETLLRSGGTEAPTPGETDPAEITTITHSLTETYAAAPSVVLVPKCDWDMYISSVSTTQVVVAIGGSGTSDTVDYEVLVF